MVSHPSLWSLRAAAMIWLLPILVGLALAGVIFWAVHWGAKYYDDSPYGGYWY